MHARFVNKELCPGSDPSLLDLMRQRCWDECGIRQHRSELRKSQRDRRRQGGILISQSQQVSTREISHRRRTPVPACHRAYSFSIDHTLPAHLHSAWRACATLVLRPLADQCSLFSFRLSSSSWKISRVSSFSASKVGGSDKENCAIEFWGPEPTTKWWSILKTSP